MAEICVRMWGICCVGVVLSCVYANIVIADEYFLGGNLWWFI